MQALRVWTKNQGSNLIGNNHPARLDSGEKGRYIVKGLGFPKIRVPFGGLSGT